MVSFAPRENFSPATRHTVQSFRTNQNDRDSPTMILAGNTSILDATVRSPQRLGALLVLLAAVLSLSACRARPEAFSLPITAEVNRSGFAPGTFEELDLAMNEAIKEQWVPGAVLSIRRNGSPVYERAVGTERMGESADRVRRGTLFDVASLTKPLAGLPAALCMVDDVQELQGGTPSIAQILQHRAGYSSNIDIADIAREGLIGALGRQMPSAYPGTYDLYSNTGYMILSSMAGKRLGGEMEIQIRSRFWEPLGIKSFTWHPAKGFMGASIAVSGRKADGSFLVGEPYDPVAAGWAQVPYFPPLHSGLFATAGDVAMYFDKLMNVPSVATGDMRHLADLVYGPPTKAPAVDRPGVEIWRTPGGLESPVKEPLAEDGAEPGRYLVQTGYTGCIVWIDTKTRTTAVLLTNATGGYKPENWVKLRNNVLSTLRRNIISMDGE